MSDTSVAFIPIKPFTFSPPLTREMDSVTINTCDVWNICLIIFDMNSDRGRISRNVRGIESVTSTIKKSIIFSDILLILEPFGLDLRYAGDEGPIVEDPLGEGRRVTDLAPLGDAEIRAALPFLPPRRRVER